jgi:hypothetical protein
VAADEQFLGAAERIGRLHRFDDADRAAARADDEAFAAAEPVVADRAAPRERPVADDHSDRVPGLPSGQNM